MRMRLQAFVEENYGRSCGATRLVFCSAKEKATIKEFESWSLRRIHATIDEQEKKLRDADAAFKQKAAGLDKQHAAAKAAKESAVRAARVSLHQLLRARDLANNKKPRGYYGTGHK